MIDIINEFLAAWDSIDPRACAIAIIKLRAISGWAQTRPPDKDQSRLESQTLALAYQREPTV